MVLAHPTGITEIYIGEVTGTRVDLRSDVVARTETAKEYTAGHRLYGLIGEDLGYAYDMAAEGQSAAVAPVRPAQARRLDSLRRLRDLRAGA